MSTRAPPPPTIWLGLPGDVIYDESAETDPYSTRVGGTPCLFAEPKLESTAANANAAATQPHLACGACSQPLPLVAQAYAPTERWPHRSLLVFGCTKPGCGRKPECWRAVRCCGGGGVDREGAAAAAAPSQAAPPLPAPEEHTKDPWSAAVEGSDGNDDDGFGFGGGSSAAEAGGFGGGDDEWGAAASGLNPGGFAQLAAELDTIAAEAEEAAKKKKEVVTSAAKQQPAAETTTATTTAGWRGWPGASAPPTPIPPFHLYAEEEPAAGKRRAVYRRPGGTGGGDQQQQQQEEEQQATGGNNSNDTDDDGPLAAETYERDAPPPGVAASYVRFGQRLARKPDQCARYVAPASASGGAARSSASSSGLLWPLARPPRPQPCPHCGAPRRFELQLMPALIAMALEAGQELGLEVPVAVVAGGGEGEDDGKEAAAQSGPAEPSPSSVLAGISDWEWCTVAVFTCSADCDGGGGGKSNNGGASSAAASPPLLLTEEAVALANEADVHAAVGGAGPRAVGAGGAGASSSQQQQGGSESATAEGDNDEDDDDDDEDGW